MKAMKQPKTKALLVFVLVCVLALGGLNAFAQQESAPWSVVLFDRSNGTLQFLSPTGTDSTATLPSYDEINTTYGAQLSADGNYMAFAGVTGVANEPAVTALYIADLAAETCCTPLPDPLPAGADTIYIGPFSPDGTQLVAALAKAAPTDGTTGITGIIAIYNLADGSVSETLPLGALQGDDETVPAIAVFGDWTADGIQLAPTCLACEQPTSGQYQLWQPGTETVSESDAYYNFLVQDLGATGEAIGTGVDENLPLAPEGQFMRQPPNVVQYYADLNPATQPIVIYSDPENPAIKSASWVLDGQAVLVTKLGTPEATLLFRDGSQQVVEVPEIATFLIGTTDGWLMVNQGTIEHYVFAEAEVNSTPIGEAEGFLNIIERTPLGSSATPGFEGFATE